MKLQSFARRVSTLGCGLAAILAATACGDDTSGTVSFDAGGTTENTHDATTDAGSLASDAGLDASVATDGSDGGGLDASAPDASAPDGTAASDGGDGGDGGDDGDTNPDADAATPDGGDAGAGSGTGTTSANLIVNGDAEAATGSTSGAPVTTPAWTSVGEATAQQYGMGSYPALTDPGPTDRGMNLFIGGQADAMSSLTQTIDVSADAAQIDAAGVTYTLSGWLGGYEDQEDYATLTVTFQDTTGTALGMGTIGPVTAEDRSNVTELLERGTTGSVPAGTRSVLVVLAMVREAGANNDGYADDLSLTFGGL